MSKRSLEWPYPYQVAVPLWRNGRFIKQLWRKHRDGDVYRYDLVSEEDETERFQRATEEFERDTWDAIMRGIEEYG